MFGKYYNNILEKIKILKETPTYNIFAKDKLDKLEQKFLIDSVRLYGKSETEYNNYISSKQFINVLNSISEMFPKKTQEEYNKIPIKIKYNIKENICKNCNTALANRNSRLICDTCGYNELIQQIYYGELYTKKPTKVKETVDAYCLEWLDIYRAKVW